MFFLLFNNTLYMRSILVLGSGVLRRLLSCMLLNIATYIQRFLFDNNLFGSAENEAFLERKNILS